MGMNLRPFGRTGLMISPLTLGTMEFGSKSTRPRRLGGSRADAYIGAPRVGGPSTPHPQVLSGSVRCCLLVPRRRMVGKCRCLTLY
jgi:hypothetical protein